MNDGVASYFTSVSDLRLETRSQALYLVSQHRDAWIPDQTLTIYRDSANRFGRASTFDITLGDLLEVAEVEDMRLRSTGGQPVILGRPVVAQGIDAIELTAAAAANDEEV